MIRLLLALIFAFSVPFLSVVTDKKAEVRFYPVTRIVDGDTFWIDDGSRSGLKIRLIGVDAPESRNTGRKETAPYGKEASEYLKKLLTGKRVRLEYDVARTDRYGRTLAYVYLENGIFVNAELVRNGYALVMTIPPNVKYQDMFIRLSRKARTRGRGLWSTGDHH